MIIAAAAAKPMTVLRIVLTPLLLEKPQPSGGNTAIPVVLPRAAIGVRGGRSPWITRNLWLDHQARRSMRRWRRTGPRICGGSDIAKALGIGRASVYRVLESVRQEYHNISCVELNGPRFLGQIIRSRRKSHVEKRLRDTTKKLQNISRMRRITMGRLPSIMRLDTTKQRHTTLAPRHGHAIHATGHA